MLEHLAVNTIIPARIVIMGAGGFVGSSIKDHIEKDGMHVLGLNKQSLDLLGKSASQRLADLLRPNDTLVVVSAIAPCKNNTMLLKNIIMMEAVCSAIEKVPPLHVIYFSSDAVYADDSNPLTENSCAEPSSLHGAMHLTREIMLKNSCRPPLAILRSSLIYGAADTHDGYGPNQFRSLAAEGKDIVLFGEGEEQRDHVYIDDVAEIVRLVIAHKSEGILNIATGNAISFKEIAEIVASHFSPPPAIKTTPRKGPMPHNGYRPFDVAATYAAFPDFSYTPVTDGLRKTAAVFSHD
jgi:UDP-glucose 4-epimerase